MEDRGSRVKRCELCETGEVDSFHHLIPRTTHRNKWFRKNFTAQEMSHGADLCKGCHRAIHRIIRSEKELGRNWNTIGKLKGHPKIKNHIQFMKKNARRLKYAR